MASSMGIAHGRKSVEPPTGAEPCLGPACAKIARAESPRAAAGKYNRTNPSIHLSPVKAADDAFYHFRGVGVQLVGIIEDNPGAKETIDRLAGRVDNRPFLIYGTGSFCAIVLPGHYIVVFDSAFSG